MLPSQQRKSDAFLKRHTTSKLAIFGGIPLHENEWPAWPRAGMAAQRAVLDVLHSRRWSISALSPRTRSYEQQFGETFAAFVGRRFGVPCSSGTAALTIALQALGIGPGDQVVVPGMTWVACASAVANLGALPILVDIDPKTLCMSPEAIESAITPATRAVLAVHMYASRANLRPIEAICNQSGIEMIEDASQAHGATLGAQRIGTFGRMSVFSFQQTKLLTSGEGGIAVTDDPLIYERLQQSRADGRVYGSDSPENSGYHHLFDKGGIMGRNMCLSEFQAAILLEGLQRLPRENEHRRSMAALLEARLSRLKGVRLVRDDLAPAEGAVFYRIPLQFRDTRLLAIGPELMAAALTAELQLPVEPLDRPLNDNPLYQPLNSPLVARLPHLAEYCDPRKFPLPRARDAWRTCVGLPHYCLMGGEPEIDAIVAAVEKIQTNYELLLARSNQDEGR